MPVLGIGGLFFRAQDPEGLAAWYKQHLGVGAGCSADPDVESGDYVWMAQGGPVVFAPFAADSNNFAADNAFMVNLRVRDLDGMIAALREAGIAVVTKPEWDMPEVGRFARIHDPEGNAVELWEQMDAGK
ncbi:glyoxalase/bleomycin resistance/dioxygenase family protein [soil metagenome]